MFSVPVNLELRLEVHKGNLVFKAVQVGEYPYYREEVLASAELSLSSLKQALEDET